MQRKTLLVLGLSLLLSACDGQNAGAPTGAGGEQEVGVVTLRGQSVTLSSELTGRVNATMTSDVRPQVDGIIKQRLFTEGAEVKAGQVLYQIDPASYQASYDQAAAQLKNAQATVQSTRLKSQRYAALVKENGVSQQDADDAKAAYLAAVASVAQYQAALETARINLAYTQVRAPIAGRIGISSVTPGALVTASQTDALATIRALDPIYVDLTQSSAQLLKLRRQQAALQRGAVTPVAIKLEDGTPYAHAGKLELTEVAVDEATGSVTLRAVFPNPEHELLPGMYVHATVDNGVDPKAILAPQQGITRNAKGEATALVVDEQNNVAQRTVSAERVVGSNWLIGSGLNEGDRLIVEGTGKVTIGAAVKPVEVSVDKTQRGEQ
ncbi:efflux RND transporter periplasmic adaptor subunit [Serratia bockelmannii]|jgi:membrane fusion protein (multidrug efflux system)|uniref:Multidrug efflux protein n=1 Tax=Serratia marcescens subsp. marcescens Db11 TaxID=273526 RepID=A0ABC9IHR4_SERMA|nr:MULTISPECIES: efflux RND transporter periplasmic adaptor subunit [Serratia]QHI78292.1 efflux RND transporter periplasmic adaptor subunit [Serratia sp. NGAS9]EMB2734362.1 efflux RND transporter periplasmic adaptor subunit [Serratia marcescens]EMB2738528.1 efflux RND transporter periplasmic adaptor subunit [Serratia marcescens]MBH2534440.1 efflux RND transporter periplasmic adaptor subunit [Serratia marcescens]MBH2624411.1 efflux RND transporter periplasmic adaptor subunit [Serratia marcescen